MNDSTILILDELENELNISLLIKYEENEIQDLKTVNTTSIISSVVYCVICLFGLIGNSLVIVVVVRYSTKKTVTDWYLANLG